MRFLAPLLSAALATQAVADCKTDAMLVFDGSGSMGGSGFVQNETPRIEEARVAMARVLPEVEHHRRIGLVTYGRGGSCDGVRTHFGPRAMAASPILTALAGLEPQGLTPLAESVEQAADVLEYRARAATVVLVTDGNDTCGGRPCARIARMQAAAADLTVHVLGFKVVGDISTAGTGLSGLLPKGEVEARCMAERTGGRYTLADTTGELVAALRAALGCDPLS